MVVERVRLHHVDDVEPVGLTRTCVTYPEVVPLGVTSCIIVRLQNQIVFELVNLDGSSQVS